MRAILRGPAHASATAEGASSGPQAGAGLPPDDRGLTRHDWLAAGLIVLAVLAVGLPGITTAGLGWSDAPLHALDGVFVLEFLRAMPLGDPLGWAEQFYLRHPALGIVVYYPPGFALIEAAMYAVAGVSVVTARATVILFAAGAALLMYALGRRWFDRRVGAIGALLLVTCPHGVQWLRDVMLEWPATFWILAAIYAYERDRETCSRTWVLAAAGAVLMAFLTKQTAGFIGPVLLLHALWCERRRAYWNRPTLWGAAGAVGLAVLLYLRLSSSFAALPRTLLQPSPDAWYYLSHLPEIAGWPLLCVTAIGLVRLRHTASPEAARLTCLMLLVWFLFCTTISAKEPRYFFYALVPMAWIGASLAARTPRSGQVETGSARLGRQGQRVALVVAILIQAWLAPIGRTGRLPRFQDAVAQLAGRPDADLVLVDGVRDGQFVFDAYADPAARERLIPIRASKLLYARAARERYGYRQFVRNADDIVELLDRHGIRYIAIESEHPTTHYREADPPPRRWLRRLLATDSRFERIGGWPLRCRDPIWDRVELHLYAYPSCPPRRSEKLTFSMPSMGRDVTLDLPSAIRAGGGNRPAESSQGRPR